MQPPISSKLIQWNFLSLIKLALRHDDWVEVAIEEASLIDATDSKKVYVHVEFPDEHNILEVPRVWAIKAWRDSVEKHERAKKRSDATKLEIENYKTNVNRVAEALMKLSGSPLDDCLYLAQKFLIKGPTKDLFGVKLVKPYYKGVYVVLPCRTNQESEY